MDEILKLFFPHKNYWATPVIIYLNIAVFGLMFLLGEGFLSYDVDSLTAWGGNSRPLVLGGEFWRLGSCLFLHADVMHIFANLLSLFLAGVVIEPVIGTARFFIAYLACGIMASLASIGWYEDTISVGASGAIFGLYGLAVALIQFKQFPTDWIYVFLISVASMVGYAFLSGLFGGVDNAAHAGGLITGYVVGLIMIPGVKRLAESRGAPTRIL